MEPQDKNFGQFLGQTHEQTQDTENRYAGGQDIVVQNIDGGDAEDDISDEGKADEIAEDVTVDEYEEEIDEIMPDENELGEEDLNNSQYHRSITVVPDDERITSDIMTMFEYSEVIGIRTLQIGQGSPVFTDVSELHESRDMAIKELYDRKCPLIITRKVGDFKQEEHKVREMGYPADVRSEF